MGSIYRRIERHCATCKKRLARTTDREACIAAGHTIDERQSTKYWIKYTRAGKSYDESSRSNLKGVATSLLRKREGDIEAGKPVTPKIGKLLFKDAAQDLIADYKTNGKRSLGVVARRIEKHLMPYFGGMRMADITTTSVRAYIAARQTADSVVVRKARPERTKKAHKVLLPDGTKRSVPKQLLPASPEVRKPASTAEINRELALLKRTFSLGIQAGTLMHRPYIPMLRENNVRTGFFEFEQYQSVLAHLPAEVRPVITFAYLTGWRIASEILPLEWRQVDFNGGEIRLDAGTTKNGQGRVFAMTNELRSLLNAQWAEHERLKKAGHVTRHVFIRMVKEGRGEEQTEKPHRILSFSKAWKSACRAAGCPGRIPHDLRRTAVRNMVRKGISERVAMRLTGHKTPSVFARYDIVSDGDLRDAARRLDEIAPRVKEG